MKIIGTVTNIENGIYFIKSKDGIIHEVKMDERIQSNDLVFGKDTNNNSILELTLFNGNIIILKDIDKIYLDETVYSDEISESDTVIEQSTIQALIEKNLLTDTELEETEAGEEAVQSSSASYSAFFADMLYNHTNIEAKLIESEYITEKDTLKLDNLDTYYPYNNINNYYTNNTLDDNSVLTVENIDTSKDNTTVIEEPIEETNEDKNTNIDDIIEDIKDTLPEEIVEIIEDIKDVIEEPVEENNEPIFIFELNNTHNDSNTMSATYWYERKLDFGGEANTIELEIRNLDGDKKSWGTEQGEAISIEMYNNNELVDTYIYSGNKGNESETFTYTSENTFNNIKFAGEEFSDSFEVENVVATYIHSNTNLEDNKNSIDSEDNNCNHLFDLMKDFSNSIDIDFTHINNHTDHSVNNLFENNISHINLTDILTDISNNEIVMPISENTDKCETNFHNNFSIPEETKFGFSDNNHGQDELNKLMDISVIIDQY